MSDDGKEADLSDTLVVTKYKTAADICNRVLEAVKAECKCGAKLVDIATLGDDMIEELTGQVYKGKAVEKGIAFPTCLSVDNCVGHYSPLAEDATVLKAGSMLKVDLGVHIDGYVAVQATTLIIQDSDGEPITGKEADVIQCAQTCFDAALRLIRPGKHINDVSGPLNKIAETYGCNLVDGVMTHNMKQFVIDGNKCILNKPNPEQKVEDAVIEEFEVYAIDIVVSSGDGKARVLDEKQTTIYKRALNVEYHLKLKASRAILTEINKKYPCMPFPVRKLISEGGPSKLGLVECLQHGLVQQYPVLWEKEGEKIAQIKGTVLLMPNGSDRITSSALQPVKSEIEVDDPDIKALLATSIKSKKKSKKSSKKSSAPAES